MSVTVIALLVFFALLAVASVVASVAACRQSERDESEEAQIHRKTLFQDAKNGFTAAPRQHMFATNFDI